MSDHPPEDRARASLARHLREHAAAMRRDTPHDLPSPMGHRIDTEAMRAYAVLCDGLATELERPALAGSVRGR